ncbi:hypothetical protein [uncultured Paludibaculum sp.]|uniref:hypothetical protein n=1 Tax=uncultured Paludibaculum sp. TaxID=1765020 RepID=UPI002AAAFC12|nr:hypothetical protein [uncultured Paludibaculum sp.]
MKHWLFAGAMLAALAQSPASADDVESLHITNLNFEFRRGLTLQMHTRVRTFENLGAYNQFRGGPVLLWQTNPRLMIISGYYYTDQNRRILHTSYPIHRPFGGLQYRVWRGEFWSLDARGVAERFHSSAFSDYWRFRKRAILLRETRYGEPYLTGEAIRERGAWYGRYTAGVLWAVHPRLKVGTGYEFRQAMSGPPSHVLATLVEWRARPLKTTQRN